MSTRVDLLDLADEPEAAVVFVACVARLAEEERAAFADTMDALAAGLRSHRRHSTGQRAARIYDAPRRGGGAVDAWLTAGGKDALRRWTVACELVGTAADALERSDARKLALMARVFRAMPYHPD